MARFTATVEVPAAADRVWSTLVDWPAHGRWVPLTVVRVLTPSGAGVGARFCGRTGLGPLAFDDPMEVTRWEPPQGQDAGHCRVVKQGRVVLGEATFHVVPLGPDRCRVDWDEDVALAPVALTRPFGRLVSLAGRLGVTRALRRMAAEATRPDGGAGRG